MKTDPAGPSPKPPSADGRTFVMGGRGGRSVIEMPPIILIVFYERRLLKAKKIFATIAA
jgi:hypothetical protein